MLGPQACDDPSKAWNGPCHTALPCCPGRADGILHHELACVLTSRPLLIVIVSPVSSVSQPSVLAVPDDTVQSVFAPLCGLSSHNQTWVRLIFFHSIQLSPRKFQFESTHDSQWLYKTWFKSNFKMDLWNLIQTDSWLKKLSGYFGSNQLTTQKLSRILIRIDS